ncbi:hypothetical protein BIW11_04690 [Tropilaelaps mercedesae]|uniref:Uncharacterized protein n=1 Tax=Tropilaelaps mercedesae TaxID=418985 RepID=A0A1V9X354_9ACAR|nr:hypothetical protein BIW11_04690 [Tropilaelaps mercedesae]
MILRLRRFIMHSRQRSSYQNLTSSLQSSSNFEYQTTEVIGSKYTTAMGYLSTAPTVRKSLCACVGMVDLIV